MNDKMSEWKKLYDLYGKDMERTAKIIADFGYSCADVLEAIQYIENAAFGIMETVWKTLKELIEQAQDILSAPRQTRAKRKWIALGQTNAHAARQQHRPP